MNLKLASADRTRVDKYSVSGHLDPSGNDKRSAVKTRHIFDQTVSYVFVLTLGYFYQTRRRIDTSQRSYPRETLPSLFTWRARTNNEGGTGKKLSRTNLARTIYDEKK